MEGFGILIPLAPFIMVVLIIAIPAWLKSKEKREMQQTLRTAIEKGQTLPPELIEQLNKDSQKVQPSAQRDLRQGVIWLAVGLGIAAFAWFVGMEEGDALNPILGMAAIPTLIGVAFIVLSFFNKNKD
ncbi:DUF6249 domain-containing protein [Brevundimonas sp. 2R-24]|uniref:DUF6249 domain-containing protein n=1 Tax=Peiella sedimenti TaxID=3061083 RepID=A0ABT8SL09_9CAUL|nr:DUF6249 domain-containing protein [Caulobacteraceae bacterium XZ-24]